MSQTSEHNNINKIQKFISETVIRNSWISVEKENLMLKTFSAFSLKQYSWQWRSQPSVVGGWLWPKRVDMLKGVLKLEIPLFDEVARGGGVQTTLWLRHWFLKMLQFEQLISRTKVVKSFDHFFSTHNVFISEQQAPNFFNYLEYKAFWITSFSWLIICSSRNFV